MCSSPTHDAVGAGAGLLALSLLTDQRIEPAGILVMVGCTALMGVAETRASMRCRREEEPLRVPRAALRAELRLKGLSSEDAAHEAYKRFPRPRWEGPRKPLRRKLRLIALVGLILSAWPVAIAYATSRLPDQLEIGGIDHRTVTHYLATVGGLLAGVHFGLLGLGVDREIAGTVELFAGIGIVGHLAADMISRGGLPVLWPFVRRDLFLLPRRLRLRVGSAVDAGLMLALSGGTVWLAVTMGGWT